MTTPSTSAVLDRPADQANWPIYARLLAVSISWGGTFIAGRVIALALPPAVGAVLRFVVAASALFLAARWLEGGLPRLTRQQFWATFALGATGVLGYNLLFFGALSHIHASRTSLIVALNPVVTMIGAALLLGERLTLKRGLGAVLAVSGVWIVVSRGDVTSTLSRAMGIGELLMFGAVCAWAAYTLIGRVVLRGLTPLAATTYAALWGTALLAVVAVFDAPAVRLSALTPSLILATLYLSLIGTALAYVWYSLGVQRLGAARTVIFINLVPVFGACSGVLLLGEPFLTSMLVGGMVAVTGVMLASSSKA